MCHRSSSQEVNSEMDIQVHAGYWRVLSRSTGEGYRKKDWPGGKLNCDAVATEASVGSIRSLFRAVPNWGERDKPLPPALIGHWVQVSTKSDMTLDQEAFFG